MISAFTIFFMVRLQMLFVLTIHVSSGGFQRRFDVFVFVYLNDKKTVYEYTDIPLDGLPETLQQEIHNGKYVETSAALYGFLENYSS